MAKSEKAIMNDVLVALSAEPDSLVYRNNTGQAWQGERMDARAGDWIEVEPNMVILCNGRPINFGLVGSGDIHGIVRRRPVAVEIKTDTGRQATQQHKFERSWRNVGGIYILARSVDETLEKLHVSIRDR